MLCKSTENMDEEKKEKLTEMQTKVWHMSVILQYRKQLLDFHLASHPTYYTELYSNYEPNVVLLTPFFNFLKKCLKFSHRLYTQWLHYKNV